MDKNQVVKAKERFENLLNSDSFQQSLADVAPKHITKERIVKLALVAMSRQPKLFECSDPSILQSIMKSGELGLDCVGTLGQGYLVPFYNGKTKTLECQFIPGYQGLIELARRSGHVNRIESRVVYEKDQFDIEYGLDQKLRHTPSFADNRGAIRCFYAIAELKGGGNQIEIMTLKEINAIRDRSKAKSSGPWVTDFSEMGRKTVVKRIFKYLPKSPELCVAIEADNIQYDDLHSAEITDQIQTGAAACKERMKKSVESKEIKKDDPKPKPKAEPEPDKVTEFIDAEKQDRYGDEKKAAEDAKLKAAAETAKKKTDKMPEFICDDCDFQFNEVDIEIGDDGGQCPKCHSDNFKKNF